MIQFFVGMAIGGLFGITLMCIVSVCAFEDDIKGGEDA